MGPMAHGGLAHATSLAAAFNVSVLFAILVKRLGVFLLPTCWILCADFLGLTCYGRVPVLLEG